MEGMFSWLQPVGVIIVQGEETTAVLHQHTGITGYYSRAEIMVDRLNIGNHQPIGVYCTKVDGITTRGLLIEILAIMHAGLNFTQRLACVNQPAALIGVLFR